MVDEYIPQDIESKWQKRWADDGLYRAEIDCDAPKHYALTMLPYPSGDLHIGHWYAMAPSDARARYMRLRGYNVMFPMGFDAFGLPAENAAIERGIHPYKWTMSNIENMRRQLRSMGAMFDWEREAISCLPGYYRWDQWFFLKLYDMGLAYRKEAAVDFCPNCNTTLAREQVWGEDRHCERCGTPVIKKELAQWFWRITDYADELLDFSDVDWPDRVVTMQTNWIGRSEGAKVVFQTENGDAMEVFTTRPDTLWGATFMVLAPEHPLVDKVTTEEQRDAVEVYQAEASRRTEIERLSTEKEKTGVFTGAYAINPVNDERIPIWIADYVMMTYGTGAIMAVPAHDERDFQFALKYGLPIIPVVDRPDAQGKSCVAQGTMVEGFVEALTEAGISFEEEDGTTYVTLDEHKGEVDSYVELAREHVRAGFWTEVVGARWVFIFSDDVVSFGSVGEGREILARCKQLEPELADKRTVMEMLSNVPFYRDLLFHTEYGTMINSGPFTGTPGDVAVEKVTDWLEEQGIGEHDVNYRLRDWLVSRQRYWGAPIPIVYCEKCGTVSVPYEDLPVELPKDAEFLPTGESPLRHHEGFLHATCPECGGPATRETDTMDTFVDSSWYQYAYLSPYHKESEPLSPDSTPFDPEEAEYWAPVDVYTGGIEHATMHLIYTRFFTKVMRDMGLVDFDEPMLVLRNQGIILGEDGEKMSKSRGNVVSPDELVEQYGADTVRGYLMFGWRWDQGGPWDPQGIQGVYRWLHRVWTLVLEPGEVDGTPTDEQISELQRATHQTIRSVTDDMEAFSFNTSIAHLMEFTNTLQKAKRTPVYNTDAWHEAIEALLLLMAPSCPSITEELWARTGRTYSIHQQSWPEFDPDLAAEEMITLVVQVNGKLRARMDVPAEISEEEAKEAALADENVRRHLEDKDVKRLIYVPGRLVNVVAN
jgi:leucyl-tRNA synthetase